MTFGLRSVSITSKSLMSESSLLNWSLLAWCLVFSCGQWSVSSDLLAVVWTRHAVCSWFEDEDKKEEDGIEENELLFDLVREMLIIKYFIIVVVGKSVILSTYQTSLMSIF